MASVVGVAILSKELWAAFAATLPSGAARRDLEVGLQRDPDSFKNPPILEEEVTDAFGRSKGGRICGSRYRYTRRTNTTGDVELVHNLIMRCSNGAPDAETGEWVMQDVPKDANGNDMVVMHGGPGLAPDAERRDADGYERNWLVDLRWATQEEYAVYLAGERARAMAALAALAAAYTQTGGGKRKAGRRRKS